jgi:hypothetical protein
MFFVLLIALHLVDEPHGAFLLAPHFLCLIVGPVREEHRLRVFENRVLRRI